MLMAAPSVYHRIPPFKKEFRMKKTLFILIIVFCSVSILRGGDRVLVSVTGNMYSHADESYRDTYSSSTFMPEFQIGFHLKNNLYAGLAYGLFSKEGNTPILNEPAESTQHVITIRAGYRPMLAEKIGSDLSLGLVDFIYKEAALGVEESGSQLGLAIGAGLFYRISDVILFRLDLNYLMGSKEINEISVKMGGFKAGIGAGIFL